MWESLEKGLPFLFRKEYMKKIYWVISAVIIAVGFGTFQFYKNKKVQYTIGIIQCASFPPIDEAIRNFMVKTKELFGENEVNFIFANAENSSVNAHAIAQRFITNRNIDAFFTTDTTTTQAVFSLEKKRPIVFMAVEKPEEIGLIHKKTNACGITDRIPPHAVQELVELIPCINQKRIGLLAKNETSRKLLLDEVAELLISSGYKISIFTPLNEMELIEQLPSILTKIDVLVSPIPDSMIGSTISLLAKETKDKKIPFLVCLEHGAASGAFASRGVNYPKNGTKAAEMMFLILKDNVQPATFTLQPGGYETIYVNSEVLDKLGYKNEMNSKLNEKIIFC